MSSRASMWQSRQRGMEKFQLIPAPLSSRVVEADGIRERRFGTDRTPDYIELVLEIIVAACQWDELFDLTGWRVVCIHSATHRLAVAAEDVL